MKRKIVCLLTVFSLISMMLLFGCTGEAPPQNEGNGAAKNGEEGTEAVAKFPTQPITLYATFTGVTETSGRLLAEAASKYLDFPVNLVPKPGGSGVIAMEEVARAKDGHTLGILTGAQNSVQLMRGAPFDVIEDFTPIMQFLDFRWGIPVRPDSPFETLEDLLEYCRENPGKVNYSTGGAGAISHLCMEAVLHGAGVKANVIPTEGAPDALRMVLGGHVDTASICFWEEYVNEGQLRLLAVFLDERSPDFPDVPTTKELGFGLPPAPYVGIAGPAGMPKEHVKILEEAFTKGLNDPIFTEGMKNITMEITYKNSEDYAKAIEEGYHELDKILDVLDLKEN